MEKPRVFIIENAVEPTGSLFSILRCSASLKDDFSFEFIVPREGRVAAIIRAHGFQTWVIPMKELRRDLFSVLCYPPALLLNVLRFSRVLKRTSAPLVVNNDFYNLLPALAAMLGYRTPYVCYVRFMPSKFPRILTQLWFGLHEKYSSRVIAVSEAVKRELPESKKIVVVHNELPDQTVEHKTGTASLILFPSNYITGKGHDLALEAFARIANAYPHWTLRFVGGDMGLAKNKAFKASLIRCAQELQLTQRIEFLDFSDNLAEHYQEAAFVLNFSESESFSLTTVEAQFYGRPVIVTRCGGPEEIVVDGETGILVPVKDIDSMTKALEHLITHPEIRQQMGARAYVHVREKFSYENTIGKLAHIYREAINATQ